MTTSPVHNPLEHGEQHTHTSTHYILIHIIDQSKCLLLWSNRSNCSVIEIIELKDYKRKKRRWGICYEFQNKSNTLTCKHTILVLQFSNSTAVFQKKVKVELTRPLYSLFQCLVSHPC